MINVSSVYLHVPFCKHLCNYCDFYKRKLENKTDQFDSYENFLSQSIERHKELMRIQNVQWTKLDTLYLGGGTPSLWGSRGAEFFKNVFLQQFSIEPDAEFTMEIDPGSWNEEMIGSWKDLGLNRISIGTQSLNPDFLKVMDRDHSIEESVELLNYCHKKSWNFSLDFLLGIPFSIEKKRNVIDELNRLLEYSPSHISLYILNARSKYPHIQQLPDDEFIREEYLEVSHYLTHHGFNHYEVSNFAKPGFESKHNLKYWRSESVAAFGPTGTGYFALEKNQAIRYKWKVIEPQFEIEKLSQQELNLEKTYLGLRTSSGWTPTDIKGMDCLIQSWINQGYGRYTDNRFVPSAMGYLMLDSLMDDIFRLEAH